MNKIILLVLVLALSTGCLSTLDVKDGELQATSNYNETVAAVAIAKAAAVIQFAHACHGNIPKEDTVETFGDVFDDDGNAIGREVATSTTTLTYTAPAIIPAPVFKCAANDASCAMAYALAWTGTANAEAARTRTGSNCVVNVAREAQQANSVAAREATSSSVGITQQLMGAVPSIVQGVQAVLSGKNIRDTALGVVASLGQPTGPTYTNSYNTRSSRDGNTSLVAGDGSIVHSPGSQIGNNSTTASSSAITLTDSHLGNRANDRNTGLIDSTGCVGRQCQPANILNPVTNQPSFEENCVYLPNPDPLAPGTFIEYCRKP